MPLQTVWGGLPGMSLHVLAKTAGGGIINITGASGARGFTGSFVLDRDQTDFLDSEQPGITISVPGAVAIPEAPPEGAGAGYFRTNVIVVVSTQYIETYNKINSALRKAESWGWSHVLAKTRVVMPVGILDLLWPYSIAFPWVPRGITFIEFSYVSRAKLEDLAWTLTHESVHHALYSSVAFPFGLRGFAAEERKHHLGTGMAFVLNAATLDALDLSDPQKWPNQSDSPPADGYNLTPTKQPTDLPDLRSKSVVQPVPQDSGDRLDSIALVLGDYGVGGWVDEFGPSLNYVGSEVPPSLPVLVLDLAKPDRELAWQIAYVTMETTAVKWAEYGRILNSLVKEAWQMGMLTLMARIGLAL